MGFLNRVRKTRLRSAGLLILVVAYIVVSLWPLLRSGYYGDDAINSQTRGYVALDFGSVFKLTSHYFVLWTMKEGRLFPLAWYVYFLFDNVPSLLSYKILIMAFLCFNVLSFGYLVKLMTGNNGFSIIVMILLPVLFQFRIYADPILSFHLLMQLIFTYVCFSLIFLELSFREQKIGFLVLSALFYAFALLTYEISYLFFFFHIAICLRRSASLRSALPKTAPYVGLSMLAIGTSIYLRSHALGIDPRYEIQMDLAAYAKTLLKQSAAAFPLDYFVFNPSRAFSRHLKDVIGQIQWMDPFLAAVPVLAFLHVKKVKAEKVSYGYVILFAALLTLLPGAMMSFSPVHHPMGWGLGYLPVYIEYFGVALGGVAMCALLVYRARSITVQRIVLVTFACLAGVAALINLQINRIVVEKSNIWAYYPRATLEAALRRHILEDVPARATIVFENDTTWNNQYFLYMYTGKEYNTLNTADFMKSTKQASMVPGGKAANFESKQVYMIRYFSQERGKGYLLLGKIEDVVSDHKDSQKEAILADRLRYFNLEKNKLDTALYTRTRPAGSVEGEFTPSFVNMHATPNFYDVPLNGNYVDFNSLQVVDSLKPYHLGSEIDLQEETYFVVGWSGEEGTHRWSEGKRSEIWFSSRGIDKNANYELIVNIDMTSGPQNIVISINGHKIMKTKVDGPNKLEIGFPGTILSGGVDDITFDLPDAKKPRSQDPRVRGIALGSLQITFAPPSQRL